MLFKINGFGKIQRFANREEAGFQLAKIIQNLNLPNPLVYAIPRGGVVVGAEISKELRAPLLVFPVKKIGAPANPELAIGAVGPFGKPYFDKSLIFNLQIPQDVLRAEVKKARDEVKRRMLDYQVQDLNLRDKTVILTDDGVATGATMTLAGELIKSGKPKEIVLAVPVAPKSKLAAFKKIFDEVIVLLTPEDFKAVGQFYYNFPEVSTEQVKKLLTLVN